MVSGVSALAPTPCTTRSASTHSKLGASPTAAPPSPNSTNPPNSSGRRPCRSAMAPATGARKMIGTV